MPPVPPNSPVSFRKQMLGGERVLYYPAHQVPTGVWTWLREIAAYRPSSFMKISAISLSVIFILLRRATILQSHHSS